MATKLYSRIGVFAVSALCALSVAVLPAIALAQTYGEGTYGGGLYSEGEQQSSGGGGGGGGGSSRSSRSSSSDDDDDDTSTTTASTDRAALLAQIETLTKELARLQSLLGVGSSVPTGFTFLTDLSIGSRTDDVQRLQQFLNSKGYIVNARPDGAGAPGRESMYFGDLTREALARFQAANSITPAVGYFGPITRALVNSLLP